MKSNLRKAIIGGIYVILLLFSSRTFAQQNIQFSQYIFNTISVNPAYAGNKDDWYFQMAHRQQWIGMDGAPTTTQISVDGVTDPYTKNMGIGAQFTSDKVGPQSAISLYANYAYRVKLDYADMSRLCLGLAIGLTRYGTDLPLIPIDLADPTLNLETNKTNYIPDVRFGIYYYNPKFYIGLSAMDLLSGNDSTSVWKYNTDSTNNSIRKIHFYLMGGTLLELSDEIKLRPSFMIREDFRGPTNIDLSALFVFDNRFWIGGSYRTGFQLWKNYTKNSKPLAISNAVIGMVNFQISERFRIGYSYDFSLNSLSSYQNGTHELTIGWFLAGRSKRVLSPRFF